MNKANKIIVLLFLFLFSVATLLQTDSGTVAALGQRYFDDNGGTECDFYSASFSNWCVSSGKYVRITSGQTTSVVKTDNKFRAYFRLPYKVDPLTGLPLRDANRNTELDPTKFPTNLTLTIEHADYCPALSINGAPPVPGSGHAVDTLNNGYYVTHQRQLVRGTTPITVFNIGNQTRVGKYRWDCSNDITVALRSTDFLPTNHVTGLFYVEFSAQIDSGLVGSTFACASNPNDTNCAGIQNSFSITQSGTGAFYIAHVRSTGATDGYATTIREQDPNQDYNGTSTNASFLIRYGADCTVPPAGVTRSVQFFDLDFAAGQGQPRFELRSQAPDGTVTWLHPDAQGGFSAVGTWRATGGRAGNYWEPDSRNNNLTSWSFPAKQDYKYILYMQNINPVLTQQFSTPFDGIYNKVNCDRAIINPEANIASPGPVLAVGQPVTISSDLRNTTSIPGIVTSATLKYWYSKAGGAYNAANDSGVTSFPKLAAATPIGALQTYPLLPDVNTVLTGGYNFLCTQLVASTTDPDTTVNTMPPKCAPFSNTNKPYLSIYGGDAMAGASPSFDDTTSTVSCSQNDTAGFLGWNTDSSASGWAGAGAEFAVQAMGDITSFASGLGTSHAPYELSFANDNSSLNTTGNYGGNFNSTDNINCDFMDGLGSQVGSQAIYAMNIPAGPTPVTKYVKGDVIIKGDIAYQYSNGAVVSPGSGTWGSVTDIPSYKLVVIGNIYIEPNVKTLSGTYVAMTDADGNGGIIETCAMNDTLLTDADRLTSGLGGYFNACHTPLTIYGSFVAKQVRFDRTSGDLTTDATPANNTYSTSKAAETFVYSPEMWLKSNIGVLGNTKSYVGKPPIL